MHGCQAHTRGRLIIQFRIQNHRRNARTVERPPRLLTMMARSRNDANALQWRAKAACIPSKINQPKPLLARLAEMVVNRRRARTNRARGRVIVDPTIKVINLATFEQRLRPKPYFLCRPVADPQFSRPPPDFVMRSLAV